ncbi:hypothetical protein [Hymenobacter chitinivorans]|uniref:Short subunit dehydrogenase n=1 Tax=Hymenobacter chitinivorans DSM 11115 TaxID=1121954 RepID=A0A2M9BTD4_9BACT|nr:hypothetical protein [Hymenobacter chitinivorans]PJJ61191.1 hypothetical protein CLV45_2629 [Hymenobacter chitinivorans DSM 11115]
MSTSQTWFITGASPGLGLALARPLLAAEPAPPVHLLLGQDAYQRATHQLQARPQEIEAGPPLTVSTGFGGQ